MVNDKKLRKRLRDLYYLCNNFLENTYEKRFVIYLIEEIEQIEAYISIHHSLDLSLKAFKANLPKFEKTELDQITRSTKEKLISGLVFFFIFPLFCGRILYADSNYLDDLKEKLVYRDRKREVVRNQLIGKVVKISTSTIKILKEVK